MQTFEKQGSFFKADDQGIVYGWAIVCTENGAAYTDLQGDHIPVAAMLDAAADFAKHSRVGKDMHEGDSVGEHLFLYPITKSSADLGVHSTREGLIVGFKPSDPALLDLVRSGARTGFSIGGTLSDSVEEPLGKSRIAKGAAPAASVRRTFRTFKINEISLVDKPAQEGATVGYVKSAGRVIARRRVLRKMAILTSLTDGHQHSIDLDDPATGWDSLSTSYQTAEGATSGHSHAWVHDMTTGVVTVAADSGHTHDVTEAVPADVLAACAAIMADDDKDIAAIPAAVAAETSDGIPSAVEPEESSGATMNVTIVQARAPQSPTKNAHVTPGVAAKSTPAPPAVKVKSMKPIVLTESQHAHYSKLAGDDADAFLAKTAGERDAIVKAAVDADPIVFKGEITGTEVRKSDGPLTKKLAEQNESNAKALAKAQTDVAAEIEKRQVEVYKARAKAEIGHLAGSDDAKIDLLKAIDSNSDATKRAAMTTLVASADAFAKDAGLPRGASPANDSGATVEAELTAAVEKYRVEHKLPSYEVALAKSTASDPHIRKLYEATAG